MCGGDFFSLWILWLCCCHSAILLLSVDLIFAQWLRFKEFLVFSSLFLFQIWNIQNERARIETCMGFSLSNNVITQLKSIKSRCFGHLEGIYIEGGYLLFQWSAKEVEKEKTNQRNFQTIHQRKHTSWTTGCVSNNYTMFYILYVFQSIFTTNVIQLIVRWVYSIVDCRFVFDFFPFKKGCGRDLIASLFIYVRWMHIIHKYLKE